MRPDLPGASTGNGIQLLSRDVKRRRVYGHLGWQRLDDGRWAYLHAGGGIGASGAIEGIDVDVSERLSHFQLSQPPVGADLVEAIRSSLDLVDYGPDPVVLPILCATWRAPLGDCHRGVMATGTTGNGKTWVAAIAQAHFGAGFDREHLPANFDRDTANSLERLAFEAKDGLLVIDEYVPARASNDEQ